MTTKKLLTMVFSAVIACAVIVPTARASEADQLTKVTFGEAVEIPGKVLPAGSYWFVLVGDTFNRKLVRIYSSDWKTVYATELTVDTHHIDPANSMTITFAERNSSQPQALLEWRFPGETVGHEFEYRRAEEKELAHDRQQTVVAARAGF
jgi:hypothetical protein